MSDRSVNSVTREAGAAADTVEKYEIFVSVLTGQAT